MEVSLKVVIFTILNFLLVVFIINKFLLKPVLKIFDERRQKIADDLSQAEQAKLDAEKLLSDARQQESIDREKAKELLAHAQQEVKQQEAMAAEKLQDQSQEKLRELRERLSLERDRNLSAHKKEIIDLSANIARRLLADKDIIQAEQIDAFLTELEQADVKL